MNRIQNIFLEYKNLERPLVHVIIAEFFIQMVNATFMAILPLFLVRSDYTKDEIALLITFRFIGVFSLAYPIGKYIKGKALMPFFYISSIGVPLFGLCSIFFAYQHAYLPLHICLLLWGASFTFMQIPVAPFILRNASKDNQTAGLSLSYSTWSFASIISGIIIAILYSLDKNIFDEGRLLILISILGFCGFFFLLHPSVRKFKELIEEEQERATKTTSKSKDWFIIIKALVPTLIIATGAGLTIPFISLFFDRVHHLNAAQFSIISTIASILVAYGALMVPKIKKHIGYKIAIPTTQSLAIVSLIALATTQLYSQYSLAVIVAIVCYIIRQPLMNMAGPMTTELVLTYVGKRNREITSAFTSAIWSGSWVISGLMVNLMFILGFQFVTIFLITSLLYALGVVLYYFLILEYTKKEERGEIDA